MGAYCYDYPRPAVTVDAALFCPAEGGLEVLLIRRRGAPFAGCWALPGGFLEMDETAAAAVLRELEEETGIRPEALLRFVGVYDAPQRDPRGRVISLAYTGLVPAPPPAPRGQDDATEAAWVPIDAATPLAFDHAQIMAAALRMTDHRGT